MHGIDIRKYENICSKLDWDPNEKLWNHVTLAFRRQKLLAIGINMVKTHTSNLQLPYVKHNTNISDQVGIHSERRAMHLLEKRYNLTDFSGITFLNMRFSKTGVLGTSKPCSGCMEDFRNRGFKQIIYSTTEGDYKTIQ